MKDIQVATVLILKYFVSVLLTFLNFLNIQLYKKNDIFSVINLLEVYVKLVMSQTIHHHFCIDYTQPSVYGNVMNTVSPKTRFGVIA